MYKTFRVMEMSLKYINIGIGFRKKKTGKTVKDFKLRVLDNVV